MSRGPDVRRETVDVHVHYLPEAAVEAYRRRDVPPRLIEQRDGRAVDCGHGLLYPLVPEMVDVERQLAAMDEAGISQGVLSVALPGLDPLRADDAVAVARDCNDELVEIVRRHPGRFAGLAVLPNQRPEAAATELRRTVGQGLRGAVLYTNVAGARLDEPRFRPVFDAAPELDVPLTLHPTVPSEPAPFGDHALMTTIGFLDETTICALRLVLSGLYDRHPDLKLVVPHVGAVIPYILGRIDYEAGLFEGGAGVLDVPPSEHIRRFFLDSVCVWAPALRLAVDVFGPERILFGSDAPFWGRPEALATVADLDLPADQREQILGSNAERLFGLESQEAAMAGR